MLDCSDIAAPPKGVLAAFVPETVIYTEWPIEMPFEYADNSYWSNHSRLNRDDEPDLERQRSRTMIGYT